MKRLAQGLILLSASAGVVAEPIFLPSGENLTQGPVGNFQTLIGHTNNPATGSTALEVQDWNIGFGLIPSFGFGLELGPVDNFSDELEGIEAALKQNADITALETSIDSVNAFLGAAGENAYIQFQTAFHPIAPIVWNSKDTLGGSLVFDANVAAQAKLSILDDDIVLDQLRFQQLGFTPDQLGNLEGTDLLKELLPTRSSAYIKIGAVAETSLAYSRPVFQNHLGTLHAGLRGKMYTAELRKKLIHVYDADNASKLVEDEADVGFAGESGMGIDLGVIWSAENYRVGATFKNVNAPSFNYEPIGVDCDSKTGASRDNCYVAQSFANEIDLEETWVLDPQPNIEFGVFTPSRNLYFAGSADLNPVHDPVGNELQWATVSVGYASRNWLLPSARVGYRKNLAGSQLSTVNLGLSLFKVLHLDVAYGLESVKAEGVDFPGLGGKGTLPRMVAMNLGIDFLF